jgi:hypothetical protein
MIVAQPCSSPLLLASMCVSDQPGGSAILRQGVRAAEQMDAGRRTAVQQTAGCLSVESPD